MIPQYSLAFFWGEDYPAAMSLGWSELVLLAVVGLLLFGEDMPQVSKNIVVYIRDLRRYLSNLFC